MTRPLRLLRLTPTAPMVSARVFEERIGEVLSKVAATTTAETTYFVDFVLGPPKAPRAPSEQAARFAEATGAVDVVFPCYQTQPYLPLLAAARNRARAKARLFLRAHSPAADPLDWALVSPLLAPGDLVLCPSPSAVEVLCRLAPPIAAFLRVLPPPVAVPAEGSIAGIATPRRHREARLVTLGRLHPSKLIHRVLDGVAELERSTGVRATIMIGGPLAEHGEGARYAASLRGRAGWLGVASRVQLIGEVSAREKAVHLRSASALVNLSASLEESFGMAPIEALSLGTPVLATDWDGLSTTVGGGGRLVPVHAPSGGAADDVDPREVARALAEVLQDPPEAERCRSEAEKAAPASVACTLRELLAEAVTMDRTPGPEPCELANAPAAPSGGLLARSLPLAVLSYGEALSATNAGDGMITGLREDLAAGLATPLSRLMAKLPAAEGDDGPELMVRSHGSPTERVAGTLGDPGITASSSIACATALAWRGDPAAVRCARAALPRLFANAPSRHGILVAAMALAQAAGDRGAWARLAERICQHALGAEHGTPHATLIDDGERFGPALLVVAETAARGGLPDRVGGLLAQWLSAHPYAPSTAALAEGLETARRARAPMNAHAQQIRTAGMDGAGPFSGDDDSLQHPLAPSEAVGRRLGANRATTMPCRWSTGSAHPISADRAEFHPT